MLLMDAIAVGLRPRRLQDHQRLAERHPVALADQDPLDDTALQVLHDALAPDHLHLPLGDRTGSQARQRRPHPQPPEEQQHDPAAPPHHADPVKRAGHVSPPPFILHPPPSTPSIPPPHLPYPPP